jgi:hypothetical protein
MAKKKKLGTCVYCGKSGEITRDHVVPRSLFLQPYPENIITVPACSKCNRQKAKDDEFLRDFLVADYRTKFSPVAQKLFQGKTMRAFSRKQSELLSEAVMKAELRPLMSSGGIFLGNYRMLDVDESRISLIFERLTRGLYFDALKSRLPQKCHFQVMTVQPHNMEKLIENFRPLKTREIGKGTFECAFFYSKEAPEKSQWLFLFYETALFIVKTDN